MAHKWADEEEDDVKDNWDDEDEEEDSKASSKSDAAAEAPKPAATAGKKKKGKFLKEKIAQKELEEQNRKPKTAEELAAQKLEAMRLQQESDLEVARDSLGLGGSDASVLGSVRLNTKKDFEEFAKALNDKLSAYTRSPHYIVFLESLFRDLAAGLETDDIKKLDNVLTTLFNEKIKTQKVCLHLSLLCLPSLIGTFPFSKPPRKRRRTKRSRSSAMTTTPTTTTPKATTIMMISYSRLECLAQFPLFQCIVSGLLPPPPPFIFR